MRRLLDTRQIISMYEYEPDVYELEEKRIRNKKRNSSNKTGSDDDVYEEEIDCTTNHYCFKEEKKRTWRGKRLWKKQT